MYVLTRSKMRSALFGPLCQFTIRLFYPFELEHKRLRMAAIHFHTKGANNILKNVCPGN